MIRTCLLALAALASAPPVGTRSLEVHVVGLDGAPVEKSSVLLWKLVAEPPEDARGLWRDPEGRTWQNVGGAATGNQYVRDDLEPGTYRATARLGHNQSAPVGVSDPVALAEDRPRPTLLVQLRPGPTLTLRPVESSSGDPLEDVSLRLEREGNDLPPAWNYHGAEADGRIVIEQLPPGTYRLHASRSAGRPEDQVYALAGGDMLLQLEPGVDREVRVPMAGRPLTPEEIDRRWPWVAVGTVTDTQGQPVAGAEVRVATGMGTLRGGGRTTSGPDGRFTLRFAEGGFSQGPNTQVAAFSVAKEGFVEASRSRPNDLMMSRRLPDEDQRFGLAPENIALPGEPFEIDFVLAEPATLRVELTGPPEATALSLTPRGMQHPWTSWSQLDDEAAWALLPGQPWQLTLDDRESRATIRSQPFTLPTTGTYRAELRLTTDPDQGTRTLEFTRLTDPDGRDALDRVVGHDPLASPPVSEDLQLRARAILESLARTNRLWLGPPPEEASPYSYRFRFAGEEGQVYRVGDDPVAGVVRHGISHVSALHYLTEHPERATFREVNVGDDVIELAYTLREPVGVSAGNGVLGSWRGFFSGPVREGILVIDPRTQTPREHRAGELVETFSQFVEAREGLRVPLAIRVDRGGTRFDWTFQLFEPGLWLLANAFGTDAQVLATVEDVQVHGEPARKVAEGQHP